MLKINEKHYFIQLPIITEAGLGDFAILVLNFQETSKCDNDQRKLSTEKNDGKLYIKIYDLY